MTAPRMRTYQAAAALIREADPDTCVTPYRIRQWILDGTVPHVQAGNKKLVNVDFIFAMLAGETGSTGLEPQTGGVHSVVLKTAGW